MKVLLDTCVVSEFPKPKPSERVIAAIKAIPSRDLFVSAVTIGELARGVALLAAGRRRAALEVWLARFESQYADRILGVDAEVARLWGTVAAQAQRRGNLMSAADGMIAATAIHHGLHLMTRNTDDFRETPVLLINPWK